MRNYCGQEGNIAQLCLNLRAELCARSHGDAGKQVHADAVSSRSFSAVRCRGMSAHEPLSLCSFCEAAKKQFEGVANVEIKVHDLKWAEEHKMGSFISVSRGSDEPLRFLELTYHGAANKDEGAWRLAPLCSWDDFLPPPFSFSPSRICRKGYHLRLWRNRE